MLGNLPPPRRSRQNGGGGERVMWASGWAGNGEVPLSVMAHCGSRKEMK